MRMVGSSSVTRLIRLPISGEADQSPALCSACQYCVRPLGISGAVSARSLQTRPEPRLMQNDIYTH